MKWLAALGESAGPLRAAALSFIPDLPRGAAGLRTLLEHIERYVERDDVDEDDDRGFIEGAGACLALLLIDHVGDGAHQARDGVHRVRLGPHGFFDPFGAIETILDDDDPRAALAASVRAAEAEASGSGAVSRVVARLSEELARKDPPLMVREHFEHYVRLSDDSEVDLARVVEATREGDERDVARSVDKLVGFLGGQATVLPWAEAAPRLLPRLLPPDFEARIDGDVDRSRGELAIEAIDARISVALVLGYEGRSRFVRRDELDHWERSFDDALALSVTNLAARSKTARFVRLDTEAGPLVVARTGDGLDSARLLLPSLHDVLRAELGSPFLVAVPHRDTLVASAGSPPALVAALGARAEDDASRAPHRITDALYRVTADGFSVVPESGT